MKKFLIIQITLFLFMIPLFSFAQIVGCTECTVNDLIGPNGIVQKVLNFMFMFAGSVAAIMFMYAGFLLISAGGDQGQITRAKGVFKNVIIGFVIMLVAVVAVKQLLTYIGATSFLNIIK